MKRYGKAGAALVAAALLAACTGGPAPQYYGKPVPPQAVEPAPAAAVAATAPDKGDPQQRFQAALKLMKDKQVKEAKDAFASLAQDFPQYAGPLNDLGVLQAQGRQREQAIASFAKAIADNDADAFAYGWLGILYRESGDYPRSEQAYLKAIALKPDVAAVHLNLGILYEMYLKQPDQALKQYREYQHIAGPGNLMVGVWIKQLESKQASTGLAGAAPAGAAP